LQPVRRKGSSNDVFAQSILVRDEFSKINSRSESPHRLRGGRGFSRGWGLGTSFDVHLHVFADPVLGLGKHVAKPSDLGLNAFGVKNQIVELNHNDFRSQGSTLN
jgi:hypothetical protein